MDHTPIVSVVMPVYNAAEYLGEAVDSILGQTFGDFEFIIINDGSTDGSGEILDRYQQSDDRVRVIHQENSGVAATLKRGLESARGKYVARMDSDDISLPNRLEKQVAFMESHPEVGVCGTACRLFGDSSGVTMPKTESEEIKSWLLFGPCMAHPTVIMRRDLIVKHNLYYNMEFKQAEDYELWIRFSQYCEMANIPEPLLLYRVRDKQATTEFRSEVCRWSGLVHKMAIGSLGIEPTDEELDLHLSFHSASFPKSREYVEQFEKWLRKLLEANNNNKVRDGKAFARVLFECWRCLFAGEVELGVWMWKRFTRSELFRAQANTRFAPTVSSALFFCRASVSSVLEKTRTGRSFKRFARAIANNGW